MSTSKLIYEDALVRLINGDAREIPLDDNSVGIIITSPPYNAGFAYDGYDDSLTWPSYWDGLIVPALRECYRVLEPGGRLCLNMPNVVRVSGDDWPILIETKLWPAVEAIGFLPRERITWAKGDRPEDVTTSSTAWGSWRSASKPVLRATSEPIYILDKLTHKRSKGTTEISADETKAWTRNTWFIPVRGLITGKGANPCQFPLEVPRRLMKLYGYVDDVVLDPFAGEGTTLFAAKKLGRRSIGVEQGEKQCQRAAGRCSQDMLFDEAAA